MSDKTISNTSLSPKWEGLLDGKFWLSSNSITATFDKDGNGSLNRWWFRSESYSILETNYDGFAVIYGCENWPFSWMPLIHTQSSWLLTREKNPSTKTKVSGYGIMDFKLGKLSKNYDPKTKKLDYDAHIQWKKTIQGGKQCQAFDEAANGVVEPKEETAVDNLSAQIHELRDSKAASFKDKLTDEQFYVAFKAGTERSRSGAYWNNHEEGLYKSVASGEILFSSKDKYESGTGWPSFSKPAVPMEGKKSCVTEISDSSLLMTRTEVACNVDGIHLGHVFDDGPKESGGLRYCMNSAAMKFVPKADLTDAEREFYFPEGK